MLMPRERVYIEFVVMKNDKGSSDRSSAGSEPRLGHGAALF